MKPPHYDSALRALSCVRLMTLWIEQPSEDRCASAATTSTSTCCSRASLYLQLRPAIECSWNSSLSSARYPTWREKKVINSARSRCILRCPPLRYARLLLYEGLVRTAALRHLCRTARLLHLEMDDQLLSAMVWADKLEATRPWRAKWLQSLTLYSSPREPSDLRLQALCHGLHHHLRTSTYTVIPVPMHWTTWLIIWVTGSPSSICTATANYPSHLRWHVALYGFFISRSTHRCSIPSLLLTGICICRS